jgi:hypothetical protein
MQRSLVPSTKSTSFTYIQAAIDLLPVLAKPKQFQGVGKKQAGGLQQFWRPSGLLIYVLPSSQSLSLLVPKRAAYHHWA